MQIRDLIPWNRNRDAERAEGSSHARPCFHP